MFNTILIDMLSIYHLQNRTQHLIIYRYVSVDMAYKKSCQSLQFINRALRNIVGYYLNFNLFIVDIKMRTRISRTLFLFYCAMEDNLCIEFWKRTKKEKNEFYFGTPWVDIYIFSSPSCFLRWIRFLLKELLGKIEREKKCATENEKNSNIRNPWFPLLSLSLSLSLSLALSNVLMVIHISKY